LRSGEPLAGLTGSWAAVVRRLLPDKPRRHLGRIELDPNSGASADGVHEAQAGAEMIELGRPASSWR